MGSVPLYPRLSPIQTKPHGDCRAWNSDHFSCRRHFSIDMLSREKSLYIEVTQKTMENRRKFCSSLGFSNLGGCVIPIVSLRSAYAKYLRTISFDGRIVSASKLLCRLFVVQRFQLAKVGLRQFSIQILESTPEIRFDRGDIALQRVANELLSNLSVKEKNRDDESIGLENIDLPMSLFLSLEMNWNSLQMSKNTSRVWREDWRIVSTSIVTDVSRFIFLYTVDPFDLTRKEISARWQVRIECRNALLESINGKTCLSIDLELLRVYRWRCRTTYNVPDSSGIELMHSLNSFDPLFR